VASVKAVAFSLVRRPNGGSKSAAAHAASGRFALFAGGVRRSLVSAASMGLRCLGGYLMPSSFWQIDGIWSGAEARVGLAP
jgi:hypothetical protein